MRLSLLPWLSVAGACAVAGPPPPQDGAFLPPGQGPGSGLHEASVSCVAEPRVVGRIEDSELDEISGIVESSAHPNVFFVHNDSGDSPRFFAVDRAGRLLAELVLETVPLLIDAEDIALGPAPNGRRFLYLGDTGNNFASMGLGIPRRKAVLYRMTEPVVAPAARDVRISIRETVPIVFTFPSGARDVEAFFIDPQSGDLFMIAKQADGHSQILTASAAMLAAGGGELRLVGEVIFGRGGPLGGKMPTAASVARDGSAILIRTYTSVLLFQRRAGESALDALLRPPRQLTAPEEHQGEAIGFAEHDTAFVTISEGINPAIYCQKLPP